MRLNVILEVRDEERIRATVNVEGEGNCEGYCEEEETHCRPFKTGDGVESHLAITFSFGWRLGCVRGEIEVVKRTRASYSAEAVTVNVVTVEAVEAVTADAAETMAAEAEEAEAVEAEAATATTEAVTASAHLDVDSRAQGT